MSETNAAVTIEEVSQVKRRLLFDVPWDEVKKERDAVSREVSKTAKVKGFRPGKIPKNILERHYKDYIESETVANLVEKIYLNTLKSRDIPAVSQPEIEQKGIEQDQNFIFTATVEVEPAIEPKNYTGLVLEKIEHEIADVDIDRKLEEYRQMFATMEDIKEERGVREGDFVTLDFTGSIDGIKRKELEAANFLLEVGTKRFIPGFEDHLIGIEVGTAKEFTLLFPEDYYVPDIAGKEALFQVTVKSVKEKKLPLLDESFIENFQKYQTVDELKDDIRKTLAEQVKTKDASDFRNSIIENILKNNDFEVPPSTVERELQYIMADAQRRMMLEGLRKEDAAEMGNRFQDQYREAAVRVVRLTTLLKHIALKESIVVQDNDVEERIKEIAAQSKDYENTVKYLENDSVKANIRHDLLSNKVFKFIEASSDVSTVKKNLEAGEETGK